MRRITSIRAAVPVVVAVIVAATLTLALTNERGARPGEPPSGRAAVGLLAEYQSAPSAAPSILAHAEDEARRALERDSDDVEAIDALATAAAFRHDFRQALQLADRSLAVAPTRLAPLGLKGDALIELGRYGQAFEVVERSLDARPDIASYGRASYAAELRGEDGSAIALLTLAAESGLPGGPDRAAAQLQLGLLLLREGRVERAAAFFKTIGGENPGNAEAVIGAARVAVARGQLTRAARLYRTGIVALPDADHWAELADVLHALGRAAERDRAIERATEAFAAGARAEDNALERATLDADWSRPDAADIAFAEAARQRRPSILGDAALSWVLTRAGRCARGYRFAARSLRLGTRDPMLIFRAGVAARCAGDHAAATNLFERALALNPRFSARWAPLARRLAERR